MVTSSWSGGGRLSIEVSPFISWSSFISLIQDHVSGGNASKRTVKILLQAGGNIIRSQPFELLELRCSTFTWGGGMSISNFSSFRQFNTVAWKSPLAFSSSSSFMHSVLDSCRLGQPREPIFLARIPAPWRQTLAVFCRLSSTLNDEGSLVQQLGDDKISSTLWWRPVTSACFSISSCRKY